MNITGPGTNIYGATEKPFNHFLMIGSSLLNPSVTDIFISCLYAVCVWDDFLSLAFFVKQFSSIAVKDE
jgi:hypothetical protein